MEEKRIEREKETVGVVFPFLIPKIREHPTYKVIFPIAYIPVL